MTKTSKKQVSTHGKYTVRRETLSTGKENWTVISKEGGAAIITSTTSASTAAEIDKIMINHAGALKRLAKK